MAIEITNSNCRIVMDRMLCDVPCEFKSSLITALCTLFRSFSIDCETITDCETLTSLSDFTVSDSQVCVTFTDEHGEEFTRCFNREGVEITADNGLIKDTPINIQWGGSFEAPADILHNTYINSNGFLIQMSGLTLYDTGVAQLTSYGQGNITGSLAYLLGVDNTGAVIETSIPTGGDTLRFAVSGEDDTAAETRVFTLGAFTFDMFAGANSYINLQADDSGTGASADVYVDATNHEVYLAANDGAGQDSYIDVIGTEIAFVQTDGSYHFYNLTENTDADFYIVEQNGYLFKKAINPNCHIFDWQNSHTLTSFDNLITGLGTGETDLSTLTELLLSKSIVHPDHLLTDFVNDLAVPGRTITITKVGDPTVTATVTLVFVGGSVDSSQFNVTIVSATPYAFVGGDQFVVCWTEPLFTADNGLSKNTDTNIQLGSDTLTGAPLLHDTYISGAFNLSLNDGSLTVGTTAPIIAKATIVTFTDYFSVLGRKQTSTAGDVGAGIAVDGQFLITGGTTYAADGPFGGLYGELGFLGSGSWTYTGSNDEMQLGGLNGVTTVYTVDASNYNSGISIFSGGQYFLNVAGTGTIDKFAAVRALYPLITPGLTFSGTITDYYGLLVEDYSNSPVSAFITNKWGVYQKGTGETNVFNGKIKTPNLQNFANDAAAAIGGIAIGQQYRNGSVVQVRVT